MNNEETKVKKAEAQKAFFEAQARLLYKPKKSYFSGRKSVRNDGCWG